MIKNFNKQRVAIFENRKKEEMAQKIRDLSGNPVSISTIQEVSQVNGAQFAEFRDALETGDFQLFVFYTPSGVRRLLSALKEGRPSTKFSEILAKIPKVARGPKTTARLKEMGYEVAYSLNENATWRGLLSLLDKNFDLKGKKIAVQAGPEPNRLFLNELVQRGADPRVVSIYRNETPEDLVPIKSFILDSISGQIRIFIFTNSFQIKSLMKVAKQLGQANALRLSLGEGFVASIGPTTTEALISAGVTPDFESPSNTWENLILGASEEFERVLTGKKMGGNKSIEFSAETPPVRLTQDPLFLRACRCEPTERTPIWLMRQAGRYMKEYRELRQKISFLELCRNSDLSAEVTVDAAHRLDVDAAIIFSDILIPAPGMGFELSYGKDQGPQIGNPFRLESDLKRVKEFDPYEECPFLFEAIQKTRKALKAGIPLIGFAGAPYTMASYLIEGKSSKSFEKTKALMNSNFKVWDLFMSRICDVTISYLNAQIKAGVQVVQIFDSWVGSLSPAEFRRCVLPYTKRVTQSITPGIPVISFGTQTSGFLSDFGQAGGDVIGLDWRMELDEAWEILGNVAVQGNLDPAALLGNKDVIESSAQRILNQANGRAGHIFNLGHGVLPSTPIENVLTLVNYVKKASKRG